LTNITKLI